MVSPQICMVINATRSLNDIWIEDSIPNRNNLRQVFNDLDMGGYFMMETIQFVPGWSHFTLNNGMKLDNFVYMKGLEGFSFEQCLQMATLADIENIKVPFYTSINSLIIKNR